MKGYKIHKQMYPRIGDKNKKIQKYIKRGYINKNIRRYRTYIRFRQGLISPG